MEKTNKLDIPLHRRFQIDAIFVDETARLRTELEQRANKELGQLGPDAAVELAEHIVNGSIDMGGLEGSVDQALWNDAKQGVLQTHIPSLIGIRTYLAVSVICLILEVAVGGVQIIFTDTGPAVLIPAVLLALAAFLAGTGLGDMLLQGLRRTLPPQWKAAATPVEKSNRGTIMLVLGIVLVILMTVVRAQSLEGDERMVVISVTLALAVLAALFKAFHKYYSVKYDYLWDLMFIAQQWEALFRHKEARAFYEKHYATYVTHLAKGGTTKRAVQGS